MNSQKGKKRNQATPGEEKRGSYTYDYPRPALTADCVIFGFNDDRLQILLIERGVEPFKGYWALPGGFMRMNESIEQCARRELWEETNVKDVYLEQFHTFSCPDRDPRGRVVTVAFIALVRPSEYEVAGGDDANLAAWFDADVLPPLAFDHAEILRSARQYLKEQLRLRPVAFRLVNEVFSVDELRKVYEAINGEKYDRRNFERKLISSEAVEPQDSGEKTAGKRAVRKFSLAKGLRSLIRKKEDIHEGGAIASGFYGDTNSDGIAYLVSESDSFYADEETRIHEEIDCSCMIHTSHDMQIEKTSLKKSQITQSENELSISETRDRKVSFKKDPKKKDDNEGSIKNLFDFID